MEGWRAEGQILQREEGFVRQPIAGTWEEVPVPRKVREVTVGAGRGGGWWGRIEWVFCVGKGETVMLMVVSWRIDWQGFSGCLRGLVLDSALDRNRWVLFYSAIQKPEETVASRGVPLSLKLRWTEVGPSRKMIVFRVACECLGFNDHTRKGVGRGELQRK